MTAKTTAPPELEEGLYELIYSGERFVVQVITCLLDQWPSTREKLMARFLSGPPRFPISVAELTEWGAEFTRIK